MDQSVVEQENVRCMGIVRQLLPWREQLSTRFGTTHGNAKLQAYDVVLVFLAAFFNPMVRSQRLIEALSSQAWIQEQTGLERIPRSTLSDSLKRFDPQQLEPVIEELVKLIPQRKLQNEPDLQQITQQILAADGSYFNLAGEVAWALVQRSGKSTKYEHAQARLDLQLDTQTFTPVAARISGKDDGGEATVLARHIKPGVIYVMDRAYVKFELYRTILESGSSFVSRLRSDVRFDADKSLPLEDRDREAQVLRDEIGVLPGARQKDKHRYKSAYSAAPPEQTLRCVTVLGEDQLELRLLTDLLDVPAYVIVALYKQRWQIELFFKWLKTYARFNHAISQSKAGLQMQFYIAVIAVLLLAMATGRRPSKYAMFWLSCVASGQATVEEMLKGLARTEREAEMNRLRYQRNKRERQQAAAKNNHS